MVGQERRSERPIGGATGIFGGVASTPPPPPGTYYGYHDPFVLFGFLAGCTEKIGFTTGVLILAQRQAVLVAKQAASLDELSGGGRLRLGIGVGWNEVEFIALSENFHNRGKRSGEQVQVMQALWAYPHRAEKMSASTGSRHASSAAAAAVRWACILSSA